MPKFWEVLTTEDGEQCLVEREQQIPSPGSKDSYVGQVNAIRNILLDEGIHKSQDACKMESDMSMETSQELNNAPVPIPTANLNQFCYADGNNVNLGSGSKEDISHSTTGIKVLDSTSESIYGDHCYVQRSSQNEPRDLDPITAAYEPPGSLKQQVPVKSLLANAPQETLPVQLSSGALKQQVPVNSLLANALQETLPVQLFSCTLKQQVPVKSLLANALQETLPVQLSSGALKQQVPVKSLHANALLTSGIVTIKPMSDKLSSGVAPSKSIPEKLPSGVARLSLIPKQSCVAPLKNTPPDLAGVAVQESITPKVSGVAAQKSPGVSTQKTSEKASPEEGPPKYIPKNSSSGVSNPKYSEKTSPEIAPPKCAPKNSSSGVSNPKASEKASSEEAPPKYIPKNSSGVSTPKSSEKALTEIAPLKCIPKNSYSGVSNPKSSKKTSPEITPPKCTPKNSFGGVTNPKSSEKTSPEIAAPKCTPKKSSSGVSTPKTIPGKSSSSGVKIMRTGFAASPLSELKLIKNQSGPDYYLKVVDSAEEVYKILRQLQKQFKILFLLKRSDPNFGSTEWKPRWLKRRNSAKEESYGYAFWSHELPTGKEVTPAIEYDGMPFMHVSTRVFQCSGSAVDGTIDEFTVHRNRSLKGARTQRMHRSKTTETGSPKHCKPSKQRSQPLVVNDSPEDGLEEEKISYDLGEGDGEYEADDLWKHCPYKVGVKQVIKFPRLSVSSPEPPTGHIRSLIRKVIKQAIDTKSTANLGGEMKYYMKIPTLMEHKTHKVSPPTVLYTSTEYQQEFLSRLHEHTKMTTYDPSIPHIQLNLEDKQEKMRIHSIALSSGSIILDHAIGNNKLCDILANILTPLDSVTLKVFMRFLYCGQLEIVEGCSVEGLMKAFQSAKMSEGVRLLERHLQRDQCDWIALAMLEFEGTKQSVSTQTTIGDFCLTASSAEEVSKLVDTSGIEPIGELKHGIDRAPKSMKATSYVHQVQNALDILFPKNASFQESKTIKEWTMAGFSLGEIVRQVFTRRLQKIGLMQDVFTLRTPTACKTCAESCMNKGHFSNPDVCVMDMGKDSGVTPPTSIQNILVTDCDSGHVYKKSIVESALELDADSEMGLVSGQTIDDSSLSMDSDTESDGNSGSDFDESALTIDAAHIAYNVGEPTSGQKRTTESYDKEINLIANVSVDDESTPADFPPAKKLKIRIPKTNSKEELFSVVHSYLRGLKTEYPGISLGAKLKSRHKSSHVTINNDKQNNDGDDDDDDGENQDAIEESMPDKPFSFVIDNVRSVSLGSAETMGCVDEGLECCQSTMDYVDEGLECCKSTASQPIHIKINQAQPLVSSPTSNPLTSEASPSVPVSSDDTRISRAPIGIGLKALEAQQSVTNQSSDEDNYSQSVT